MGCYIKVTQLLLVLDYIIAGPQYLYNKFKKHGRGGGAEFLQRHRPVKCYTNKEISAFFMMRNKNRRFPRLVDHNCEDSIFCDKDLKTLGGYNSTYIPEGVR